MGLSDSKAESVFQFVEIFLKDIESVVTGGQIHHDDGQGAVG